MEWPTPPWMTGIWSDISSSCDLVSNGPGYISVITLQNTTLSACRLGVVCPSFSSSSAQNMGEDWTNKQWIRKHMVPGKLVPSCNFSVLVRGYVRSNTQTQNGRMAEGRNERRWFREPVDNMCRPQNPFETSINQLRLTLWPCCNTWPSPQVAVQSCSSCREKRFFPVSTEISDKR